MGGAGEADSGNTTEEAFTKEPEMFTDPNTLLLIAKQRQSELIAEASRERLARSVARSRRGRSGDRRSDAQ